MRTELFANTLEPATLRIDCAFREPRREALAKLGLSLRIGRCAFRRAT